MTLAEMFKRIGCCAAVLVAMTSGTTAQSVERAPLIGREATIRIPKPGQMSLAPSGDRVAVADRFGNRILVFDVHGAMMWSSGEAAGLRQPQAILMTEATEVCFVQKGSLHLLKISERTPQSVDTITLLTAPSGKGEIRRLYRQPNGRFLVLWENPDALQRWSHDWSHPELLIEEGSEKGRLDRPTSCLSLSANRIAVSGSGRYPVQLFDKSGKFLSLVDWANPTGKSVWEASALAVDHRERIWVADITNSQYRVYDLVGNMLFYRPFAAPAQKPTDMIVSSDHQLLVLNDSGRLEIYDLSQE